METDRFDALTARLAPPLSRRGSISLLGGLGLGSLLAGATGARKKRRNRRRKLGCGAGTKRCRRKCISNAACCGGCPDGGVCQNGACTPCASGETPCGATCANLATDPANCGRCGRACHSGECLNGACSCTALTDCPEGCTCHPKTQGGGACGGRTTAKPCENFSCALGEVCLASFLLCTETC